MVSKYLLSSCLHLPLLRFHVHSTHLAFHKDTEVQVSDPYACLARILLTESSSSFWSYSHTQIHLILLLSSSSRQCSSSEAFGCQKSPNHGYRNWPKFHWWEQDMGICAPFFVLAMNYPKEAIRRGWSKGLKSLLLLNRMSFSLTPQTERWAYLPYFRRNYWFHIQLKVLSVLERVPWCYSMAVILCQLDWELSKYLVKHYFFLHFSFVENRFFS